MERAQQKAISFFYFILFFSTVLKIDNMNTDDLKYQFVTHTFSESTGVFTFPDSLSLSEVRKNSEYGSKNENKERDTGVRGRRERAIESW